MGLGDLMTGSVSTSGGALALGPTIRHHAAELLGPDAAAALHAAAPLDDDRIAILRARAMRRRRRAHERMPIGFLDPSATIPRTSIAVAAARAGDFEGIEIPADLRRQWIQGTGPAARPGASIETNLRNVAYALLSGADGWMFDGEDALGQLGAMALKSQRAIRAAIGRDPRFLDVAADVATAMNAWAGDALGRTLFDDWRQQLERTTLIYRPRGLHLDDRHVARADGRGFSASIVDAALFVGNNHARLRAAGRSIVLYLPKIQTAEEAALWHDILAAIEGALGLAVGTVKTYVLVEQIEASFQLMEIRAALAPRFVGFNTGRWDYIHSVADAMAWDPAFRHPNIDAITMTFGYMRAYEDRVRRAANTPDRNGRHVLWQGGMEPNIPVGSPAGVAAAMERAVAGAEREAAAGASGKWVAHWKMVPIVRPVWERLGRDNALDRTFPPLGYGEEDADALVALEAGPRTVAGARDLLSVALQYANAFGRGLQAAALKPADAFGDDDVLFLMEDLATAEIRLGILWEWLHKAAPFTEDDPAVGIRAGDALNDTLLARLLDEEFAKLVAADDRDVHDASKDTTLPIARAIVDDYVRADPKPPWAVDFLNITLGVDDSATARERTDRILEALRHDATRITRNLDFNVA